MDPLREAIKHRRSAAFSIDDAKLQGQPMAHSDKAAQAYGDSPQDKEQKGDLAPEADQDDISDLEGNSPEHHPLPRDPMQVDALGHEQAGPVGPDEDIEAHLMAGHELDEPRSPKTLGARVRAALSSKKGQ